VARCAGRYLDGRSAQPRAVAVEILPDGLAIEAADGGGRIDLWPWDQLTAELPPTATEARLGCTGRDLATLVVNDAGFAALLRQRVPALGKAVHPGRGGIAAVVLWGLLTLVALAGIYFGIAHGAAVVAALVPYDLERDWGAGYAQAFIGEAGAACREPAGVAALARLTARLQAAAGDARPVEVHVVEVPMINAFALPGGQIVVFSRLIDKAASADELAGVLGHEMGHAAERHALRRLIEHVGLAGAVGMVFGGAAWQEDDMVTTLLDLSYSRSMEAAADRYAVALLREADIRRDGLVSFFRRLEQRGEAPLALLSTHPTSEDRAALVDAGGGGGPAMSEADWAALKRICGEPE
jgi:Zn-dependent protease with chaperone function